MFGRHWEFFDKKGGPRASRYGNPTSACLNTILWRTTCLVFMSIYFSACDALYCGSIETSCGRVVFILVVINIVGLNGLFKFYRDGATNSPPVAGHVGQGRYPLTCDVVYASQCLSRRSRREVASHPAVQEGPRGGLPAVCSPHFLRRQWPNMHTLLIHRVRPLRLTYFPSRSGGHPPGESNPASK